ncbi:hypothetical protein [Nonomuraea sp. NPDC050310]|uniref:hypothetical protein n=1 Tax=Nonomuraea sp. NPDC050310 TaxID=3154935 RepID=UPI0033C8E822
MADRDNEIEILALWHQPTVLQRQVPKPGFTPEDRFLLSGLLHHLPMDKLRQPVLLVRPGTLMRRHSAAADPSAPWRCGSHGRTPPGATGASSGVVVVASAYAMPQASSPVPIRTSVVLDKR